MSRHEPSPTPNEWHVDTELLDRYALGTLDAAAQWSIEAHVSACQRCRRSLSPAAPAFDTTTVSSFDTVLAHIDDRDAPAAEAGAAVPVPLGDDRLHAIWSGIEHELDQPRLTVVERVMQRLGVPDHVARLLAATPSLTVAWIGAIAAVLAVTVLAAWTSRGAVQVPGGGLVGGGTGGLLLYLVTAPLLPLAGIAAAYGKHIDPTYEIGLAAPSRSGRVLLIRATAVLAVSLALSTLGALALPSFGWAAVSWVLPALALTALTLAVSSLVAPVYAATGSAVVWLSLVGYLEVRSRLPLAAFQVPTQVLALLTLAGATAWIATQRDRFELDHT